MRLLARIRNQDTVVLVPMLGRHHRVAPLLESLDTASPGVRVVFCLTPGDGKVIDEVTKAGCEYLLVPRAPRGDYARKINAGYRATSEPLIFCGADDLKFHPGWLDAARAKLGPGIGVVGTNDLGSPRVQAGEHATHSLVTRDYADTYGTIDGPGAILHEGYWHEYVDDEFVATAKYRKAWAFAHDSIVEHLHPNWGKAAMDAMYLQQRVRMRHGKALFHKRRPLWTSPSR